MYPPGPEGCPPGLPFQNTRRCACHAGYVGDGLQCVEEPEPPVDRCLDQPPPCHTDAVCTDLHFQGVLPCLFPVPSPCLQSCLQLTANPLLLQRNGLVSSTSRLPVALMV